MDATRSYLICCVQRTGSWLLAHALADTGWAGTPSDYFDDAERERRTQEWELPNDNLGPKHAVRCRCVILDGANVGRKIVVR
ncbi:MAG: Stf0 family sulfotransferase, partial [Actinomycetota bacterium]